MIIGNQGAVAETSGKKIACTIEANSIMFDLLSSRLYTNKPLAVIRELSTNGYDSQVVAGTESTPLEVHLPTILEPYFSIRDFGTGMSQETIETLYSSMGGSDKRDSNLLNGVLGVGSKAPFAYTEGGAFALSSYYNGTEYVYSVFSDVGIPNLSQLATNLTDKPNGVLISVPVKIKDIPSFDKAAMLVYSWFKVKPNINKKIEYQRTNEPIIEGVFNDGVKWGIYKNSGNSKVIMGNIAYPISGQDTILEINNLVIFANIGDVQMSASREGLSYNPSTLSKLKVWEKQIEQSIKEYIESLLTTKTNLLNALQIYTNLPCVIRSKYQNSNTKIPFINTYMDVYITTRKLQGEPCMFRLSYLHPWIDKYYNDVEMSINNFLVVKDYFIQDDLSLIKTNKLLSHLKNEGSRNFVLAKKTANVTKEEYNKTLQEFVNTFGLTVYSATELYEKYKNNAESLTNNNTKSLTTSKRTSSKAAINNKLLTCQKHLVNQYNFNSETLVKEEIEKLDSVKKVVIPTTHKMWEKNGYQLDFKELVFRLEKILNGIEYKHNVLFIEVPSSYKALNTLGIDVTDFMRAILPKVIVSYSNCVEKYTLSNDSSALRTTDTLKLALPKPLLETITFMHKWIIVNRLDYIVSGVLVKAMELDVTLEHKKSIPLKYIKILDEFKPLLCIRPDTPELQDSFVYFTHLINKKRS